MNSRSVNDDNPSFGVTPIAVVGPTGAGKSAMSLALAHELGGEIINIDSMQLYLSLIHI